MILTPALNNSLQAGSSSQTLTAQEIAEIASAVWQYDITVVTTTEQAGKQLQDAKNNARNAFAVSA